MNHIQTFVKSRLKTYSKSYSKLQDKISDILSKGNWSGSQGAWKECYEYIASHEDDFMGTSIEVASKILQDKTGYPEFIVMDVLNDLKSELVTNSECPVCHSNPCTCAQVATMSEDKLLDEVKTDLVALVTANAGDIDTAEAIEVIKSATKDDLVDMITEEIEDQGKEESLATYIEGLSKAKDKLSGYDMSNSEYNAFRSKLINNHWELKTNDYEKLTCIKDGVKVTFKFDTKVNNWKYHINNKAGIDDSEIAKWIKDLGIDPESSKYCGEMKTHSAMAELDLQFKGDLDALLKRYESSVNGLPKIGSDDTAEEFWKKCIKWADDVEKNPEPALYNELVALGKKYNVDVK